MISVHFYHPHFSKKSWGTLSYEYIIQCKLQFIFSVPQLSIFDPELLFKKQKSTPKDGLIL